MATYGLRIGFDDLPAWMTAAVGEWAQISGTTAPSSLVDFSSVALRDDGLVVEVLASLAGGHNGNNTDNSVKTLELNAGTPAWSTRVSASDMTGTDLTGLLAYTVSDGHPMPRHTYNSVHWEPTRQKYMLGGMFWGSSGSSGDFSVIDFFDPATDEWELPTFVDDVPAAAGAQVRALLSVRNPSSGVWYGLQRTASTTMNVWNPSSGDWTTVSLSAGAPGGAGGAAWDSSRSKIVQVSCVQWFVTTTSNAIGACTIDPYTGTVTTITFNSSSALTDLVAASGQMKSPSLQYDTENDCFYFYNGRTGSLTTTDSRKVYRIVPNGTSVWDVELVQGTGVSPAASDPGAMDKFRFVPRWGAAILVLPSAAVYYIRLR